MDKDLCSAMRLREFHILVAEGRDEEAVLLLRNPLETNNLRVEAEMNGIAWKVLYQKGRIPKLQKRIKERAKRECKAPGWCHYTDLLDGFLKTLEEGGPDLRFALLPEVAQATA